MDARHISVNHGALTTSVTAIETAIDDIEAELNELEAQVQVLRGNWSGEAQRAFDLSHLQWDASERRLNAIAKAMGAVAHSSNARFQGQDRRSAQVWQG